MRKLGRSWDDMECERATMEDIDERAVRYFVNRGIESQRLPESTRESTTEQVLGKLHVYENGKLKNAAPLLFGKDPEKFFPLADFRIGRFGNSEHDLMFQDVIDGNIIQMADKVIEVLRSKYLITPIHYEGMQRIDALEVPEKSLREAIYNAICHKAYTGVQIQMKVYNDKIWLWNEGSLPFDYTSESLLRPHSSKPRNKNIAYAFYLAGFIESWGRGIDIIRNGFINAGLTAPTIENTMGGVLVMMPRGVNVGAKVGAEVRDKSTFAQTFAQTFAETFAERIAVQIKQLKSQKKIYEYCKSILVEIKHNDAITIAELAKNLKVSDRSISTYLQYLRDAKVIEYDGSTNDGKWRILIS